MGRLPTNLYDELRKDRPVVQQWLDIGPLPDGSTWRISTDTTSSSAAPGPGDPVVLSWGKVREAVDPFTADPVPMGITIEITDEGNQDGSGRRKFARLVATYPRNLRRTPAELTWKGGGSTYQRFKGILTGYSLVGNLRWQLLFRTDDGAINQDSGALVPKAPLNVYFENIPDDSKGFYASIIQGDHDSNGSGNKGFIPCPLVDTVKNRYLVASGGMKAVPGVYEDDAIVETSAYTIVRETIKGALFTLIQFTTARTGFITADVEGETVNTDGTGGLLINGAALNNFLVQQVWNDWRGGARLADTAAPINSASLTTLLSVFLGRSGHESSMWIGGPAQRSAAEVLREWLDSHEARAMWQHDGKLGFGVLDPIPPADIYSSSFPHYNVENREALSDLEANFDETNIAREVSGEYVKNASTGSFLQTFRVQALDVPEKIVVSRQLHNAAARVS